MSTFSGLGTALSSLIAQRQALEVSGQNVANANTIGYTRQRAELGAIPAQQHPSMFALPAAPGDGTRVTGIARLSDVFLDARLRTETASSSALAARADAYTRLERSVGEPTATGLSGQLDELWSAWHDVANTPDAESSRAVLLQQAAVVVDRIASLYGAAATQWDQSRTEAVALVSEANAAAAGVADLNGRILSITNAGGSANELMDQRDQLVTRLSGLVGASARTRDDGSLEVMVGGNSLVTGTRSHPLALSGAPTFAAATGTASTPGATVTVVWAERPAQSVGLDGGRVAGVLSVLAPPDGTGNGGLLTEAAASYDKLATELHDQVNALHTGGVTLDGATGVDFFALDPTQPAALGLSVAITDPRAVAAALPGQGALDGKLADRIGKLGLATSGPDDIWNATVVDLGVRSSGAKQRSSVAEAARASAASAQLAQASVDTDEETVNMLAYQRAYEGAARVLTAIDEMLDTLINRTGVVGR